MSLMMHPQVADAVNDSSPAVVSFTKPLLSPPLRSNTTTTSSCSNSSNTSTNSTSSTSSTNKLILDYLLYLSIQSRLDQAQVELADDNTEATEKRWVEAASRAEKDKRAVESVVSGVLSGGNAPFNDLDQRLHLCQLANLVFGRFNNTSSSSCSSEHVITQHNTSTNTHRRVRRNNNHAQEEEINTGVFSNTIQPFCRRHRRQDCSSQQCKSTCASSTPGLTDAIPVFLKASADLLRLTLDNSSEDAVPMVFAGQRVMGGGMPPRWYDLFLELLTQAAIESYMCDGQSGLEPIHEIFSFGDVEDEDEPDQEEDEEEEDDEEEEEEAEEEDDDDDEEDEWGVSAADHHLLFPKTRTMFLFKTQRREREKEFLMVEGDDLTQHFIKLAQRYPLEAFEKSMNEFIQMTLSSTEKPALSEQGTTSTEANALPQIYKYLGDGSLLMPEIPEEDGNSSSTTTDTNMEQQQQHGQKRRASLDEEQDLPDPKRSR
ncbi:hypothetical protein K492DRAFT_175299 [Lichtheimia hyalospora FSU 10163]|nr:hypothetical protein K492DRAFT_175299 [Lichtheimia hyalospora FSU 10163]